MNSASNALRVGIFFLVGAGLLYISYNALQRPKIEDGYAVKASFENIQQLKPTNDVRMAGVKIGMVIDTELDGKMAVVTLQIESKNRIPKDSVAYISMAGLLGNNFVAINPGEAPETLREDATIKTRETQTVGDVIEEFGQIGDKVNNFLSSAEDALGGISGDGKGGSLFGSINGLVEQNREKINEIVNNLKNVSETLNGTQGTLGKLINDDGAYEEFMSIGKEVKTAAIDVGNAAKDAEEFFGEGKGLFAEVKEGKGTLGVLLYDEESAQQLRNTIDNVEEFTAQLNAPDSTLGKIIRNDELYTQAQSTLNQVESAVGSMSDSGPITAVGVVASGLF